MPTQHREIRHCVGERSDTGVIRVLSLSIEYPNPHHRGLGLFVRARLQQIAKLTEVVVIAPVTVIDYASPGRKWLPMGIPSVRQDEALTVMHPRWAYPPLGTPVNVICLFLAVLWPIARLRKAGPIHVIDAHFGFPEGVTAALLSTVTRTPFIVTLRGNEPFFARSAMGRWPLQWALRKAAFVVTVSNQLRQFAIDMGVDASRTAVIGNGVDATIFYPRDRVQSRARHAIGVNTRMILTAGSLLEAKGHHRIIQALARLTHRGIDACLVIAGSESRGGPGFERKLREMTAELGLIDRVRFAGWVDPPTLAELLSAADVFCLASDSEGWPNVVHEATSCGVPVVTTDVGSVRDMLPTEQYGLIVPVGDQRALEQALESALEREWDRESIVRRGQSRSWVKVAEEVVGVIRRVAGPDVT